MDPASRSIGRTVDRFSTVTDTARSVFFGFEWTQAETFEFGFFGWRFGVTPKLV